MAVTRPDVQPVIAIVLSVTGLAATAEGQFTSASTLETDFGIGSLERVELRLRLEQAYGVQISDEAFMAARTIADLLAAVAQGPGLTEAALTRPQAAAGTSLTSARAARTLDEILILQAGAHPEQTALTFLRAGRPDQSVTYAGLLSAARRMAGGLTAHGVGPGDRVALMLPTGLPFVAGFFGILLAGGIPVPMYPPVRPDQLEMFVRRQAGILTQAEVRVLLSWKDISGVDRWLRTIAPTLSHILPAEDLLASAPLAYEVEASSDRIAFLQYTSGSTGTPRGVILTHASLLTNLRAFGGLLELRPDDVVVSWLPLYHDMGLIGMLLGGLFYGRHIVLMGPEEFLLRPSRWLKAMHEYRGTISAAPNFAYDICAQKIPDLELVGVDLSQWRAAINGAEPVRPDTLDRFVGRFAPYGLPRSALQPAYGLAEATLAISMGAPGAGPRIDFVSRDTLDRESWAGPAIGDERVAPFVSCGRVADGVQVRIVDERGIPLEERWQGRLQFRGESAFQGYWADETASQEVMRADGWIESGDLAYMADGEIYLTGRKKAVIVKGGRNVHAEDVERLAWPVPGVRSGCVAAFGVEDAGTEKLIVVAESRLEDGSEVRRMAEEIRQGVADGLGLPPDEVRIVRPGSVPKTPSGKIRRSACRDLYLDGSLGRRVGLVAQMARLAGESPHLWVRRARRGVYGGWLVSCLTAYGGVLLAAGMLGMAGVTAGPASRTLLRLVGFRLEVRGRRSGQGPLLLVPNHASALDPVVVMAAWQGPVRFVTAAWIADNAVLKPILRGLRGIRIKRGGAAHAPVEVAQMEAALSDSVPLVAFAEGGLEPSPGLRTFMLGPFQAACRQRVAVIPVALRGTRRGLRWGTRLPQPGLLQVTFGEPIVPQGDSWDHVTALAQEVRQVVAEHCGEPLIQRRLQRED